MEEKKAKAGKIRLLPASEERQYMIDREYEVYEKAD